MKRKMSAEKELAIDLIEDLEEQKVMEVREEDEETNKDNTSPNGRHLPEINSHRAHVAFQDPSIEEEEKHTPEDEYDEEQKQPLTAYEQR